MPFPKVYSGRGEGTIATYDFVDIIAGSGIINFYAGKTVDSNLISNNKFYSEPKKTTYSGGASTTVDFVVTINRPMTLRGKTVVNVPMSATQDNAANNSTYVVVNIKKNAATIATNTGAVWTWAGNGPSTYYHMSAIDIDIPLTTFAKGDILMLEIVHNISTGAGNWTVGFAHNPMNETTDWDTTGAVPSILIFQCPVRIDL